MTRRSYALSVYCCQRQWRYNATVEEQSIQCPFCGQSFEIEVDTSVASQRFVTDCEICCRPMEVSVECAPGEILSLDVRPN
jgi:hypothetical protein